MIKKVSVILLSVILFSGCKDCSTVEVGSNSYKNCAPTYAGTGDDGKPTIFFKCDKP